MLMDISQRGPKLSVATIIDAIMGRGLEAITPELIEELIKSGLINREDVPTMEMYAAAGAMFQRNGQTIWFPPEFDDVEQADG
jgi:hypothetical protein